VVEKAGAALNFDQHQVEKSAANFKEFIESRGRETGA
jgi:glutaredoxin-related protein